MQILKFYSKTCGPCKVMDLNLKKLGVDYKEIEVQENPDLVEKYNVRGIPTIIKIDDEGNIIDSFTGVMSVTQLEHWL